MPHTQQSSARLPIANSSHKPMVLFKTHMHQQIGKGKNAEKEIEVITLDDDYDEDEAARQLTANSEDSALGLDAVLELPFAPTQFELSSMKQSINPQENNFQAAIYLATSQRMMHSTVPLSSVISSSISTSLSLPRNITVADNVIPFEMSVKFDDLSTKYDRLHHSSEGISEWSQKSDPAISFITKSLSSSSSTSSGCSSDNELAHSPEADHSHHDTSPDSPDSGVSGSLNSPDDLKLVDEEEEDNVNISCQISQSNQNLEVTNFDVYSRELNSVQIKSSSDVTKSTDSASSGDLVFHHNTSQLSVASKIKISAIQLHCKWRDCDWPGSYEELAEHVREIHVELQPFLDPISGKLIKWSKQKCHEKSTNDDEDDDCISNASENDDNDEEDDEEVEAVDPDDDSQSISSNSSCRVTRRSNRGQGLFDYSQNNSRSYKLRQSSRLCDPRTISEKPSENQFVCLWKGCKVYGKPSLSRQWLERHVLELHSGPKPFKCIVDFCGQRFKTQLSLQRHVNTHFKGTNMANCANNMLNSTAVQATNSKNTGKAHSDENCCCRCTCHSCLVCDKNGDEKSITRPDKNRCDSTDSAISLHSSTSADSLPSPFKSLSKSTNSSNAITEHCHGNCCMSTSKSKVDNLAALLLQKNKVAKNNKKNSTTIRPNVKGWSQFDFYDQCSANLVKNNLRTNQAVRLKVGCSLLKVGHMKKGKFVAKTCNGDSDYSEDELSELESLSMSDDQPFANVPKKVKRKVVGIFERKLFCENQTEGNFIFHSEVIGSCYSNGEQLIRLRWHPLGILSEMWIKKCQLEKHCSRSVPFAELPEEFQKFLKARSQTMCSKPSTKKRKFSK